MNKKLVISIFVAIALVIVLAMVWFFFFATKQVPAPSTTSPVTLPSSGSTSVSPTTVGALSGGTMTTQDFIHNGVTIPDAANNGRYLLAGNLGYCVTDAQKCQAGTATDFNIFYDSTNGAFTIALLKEPLGQVRLEMEQFLMNTLGITQAEMCKLNYYVGTTSDVNPLYDSKNLGFSFCPGATTLPK